MAEKEARDTREKGDGARGVEARERMREDRSGNENVDRMLREHDPKPSPSPSPKGDK